VNDWLYHDGPDDSAPQPAILLASRRRSKPLFPTYVSKGAIVLLAMMGFCVLVCVAFAIAEGLIQIPRFR